MSGCISMFPARRQPDLHARAQTQHAHVQLRGQLIAVAGCAVGTAQQGDRLLAQARADDPGVPAVPAVQAFGDIGEGGRDPVQAAFAPGEAAAVCRLGGRR
ncbi:hypothetical protein G6F58_013463 [Rhizopus delemar]|nr:hypothetical protein G6F58_013463 [Rhizopus delemar]